VTTRIHQFVLGIISGRMVIHMQYGLIKLQSLFSLFISVFTSPAVWDRTVLLAIWQAKCI